MSSEYHLELSILVSLPSWPVAALHEKYLWGAFRLYIDFEAGFLYHGLSTTGDIRIRFHCTGWQWLPEKLVWLRLNLLKGMYKF